MTEIGSVILLESLLGFLPFSDKHIIDLFQILLVQFIHLGTMILEHTRHLSPGIICKGYPHMKSVMKILGNFICMALDGGR